MTPISSFFGAVVAAVAIVLAGPAWAKDCELSKGSLAWPDSDTMAANSCSATPPPRLPATYHASASDGKDDSAEEEDDYEGDDEEGSDNGGGAAAPFGMDLTRDVGIDAMFAHYWYCGDNEGYPWPELDLNWCLAKWHDGRLVAPDGCYFGNTDTCSDKTWYHRARGFVWISVLGAE